MNRIGVIGIVIEDLTNAYKVNDILHLNNEIIIGRMGLPYRTRSISVISIIVDGSTDDIGKLSGQLGSINGVTVKSAMTKKEYPENQSTKENIWKNQYSL